MLNFEYSYAKLPDNFYQHVKPQYFENIALIVFNQKLGLQLGLSDKKYNSSTIANFLTGQNLENSNAIAICYAGHQYGNFVPILGDGRALLLGEIYDYNNKLYDLHLKGSGRTKFSRSGDGKAELSSMLREYLVSEAMHYLNIPTTRALAVITTGEKIYRDNSAKEGAILCRIATSHIRVGTFEYFAYNNDCDNLKVLTEYAINRHAPLLKSSSNPYLAFFQNIVELQANLIIKWLNVGFVHGVMNTDNMAISGETLDYGPCAFLDEYHSQKTFSSIDRYGRYSFGSQINILFWNLTQLGKCFALTDLDTAQEYFKFLNNYQQIFLDNYQKMMLHKIGLSKNNAPNINLLNLLLKLMEQNQADYTLTFRYLSYYLANPEFDFQRFYQPSNELKLWISSWLIQLAKEKESLTTIGQMMLKYNPAIIPRNHLVAKAINDSSNDYYFLRKFLVVLEDPYNITNEINHGDFMIAPLPSEKIYQTFCGT